MISLTKISGISAIRAAAGGFALLAGGACLVSGLSRTGGALSPPLDDTYIYLQYASRLADGHLFTYTEGASPSTGASSLLHLGLLVPGWWLGAHGSAFVGYALLLALVYLAGTLALAGLAARARAGGAMPPALLAILLLAMSGHFVWGAMTAMDTGLFALALTAVVALVAARGPEPGPAWLLAGGLVFVRPEGLAYGLTALAILYGAAWWRGRGETDPRRRSRARLIRPLWLLAALGLASLPPLLNQWLTGSPQWDSMAVKGLWSETRPDVLQKLVERLPGVWGDIALLYVRNFRLESWNPAAGWLWTGLMGAGLAVGLFRAAAGRGGAAGRLLIAWIPLGILLGGLTAAWHSHYFRYQIPLLAPVALIAVDGWWALLRIPGRRAGWLTAGLASILVVLLWPGAREMQILYGRNGANIHDQQEKVGRWLARQTPPGARIAVNDAGAIAYYSGRPILDLVGLVSHGWAEVNRQGPGALYERLESLAPADRPAFLAIYPDWFAYLVRTHFVGQVVMSADLVDNTICGGRLKQVFRPDWSLAGSGDGPVEHDDLIRDFGMTLVDRVDVADLASERAHDYRWTTSFRDRIREYPTAGDGRVVLDGGRWVSEGESMRIRVHPGQWLIMALRTESERAVTLDVSVNGRPAGPIEVARQAGVFREPLLQIPDALVTDSLLTIDVRWRHDPHGDGYASYHYWFIQ